MDYIKSLNVHDLILDVIFNKKKMEQIYEEINTNLSSKIEEFRNFIETIEKALSKISLIAE